MAKKRERKFEDHVELMLSVFESAEACRSENIALRSILRKQGLSDEAVRSRLRRILKNPGLDESGAQVVKRACEETLKRYLEFDAQEVLAKLDPYGRVQ